MSGQSGPGRVFDQDRRGPGHRTTSVLAGRAARVERPSVRALLRLVALAPLVLVVLVLGAPVARADALVVTEPQNRQELDAAPGWVTLAFDDDVDPGAAKVLVQDVRGRNVTVGELIVEGTNVTTELEEGLPRGTYTVRYRAVTTGEPFGGAYQFSFGKGTFTSLPDRSWSGTAEEPAVLSNDDPNATTTAPPPSSRPRESEPGVEVSKGTGGASPAPASPAPTSAAASDEPTASATDADPTPSASDGPSPSESQAPADEPDRRSSGPVVVAVVVGVLAVLAAIAAVVRWRVRQRAAKLD